VVATGIPLSAFDHNAAAGQAALAFRRAMRQLDTVFGKQAMAQVR
jgi:hypothetical protein